MKRCIACGAELYEKPLLKLDNMPKAAQELPTQETLGIDFGIDIALCECKGCGLVQLNSEAVEYYRDAIRSSVYTDTMRALRTSQYINWISDCSLKGKKIIEIGCGQGEFLKTLSEFDVDAYGIENNEELVAKAVAAGLNVRKNYPEEESTVFEGGPFDAFTCFNFLEHQPDPKKFLRCIFNNLTEEAYGLITVPDLQYIVNKKSYYEIIPDHIAYYTEDTITRLLGDCGFEVLQTEIVNRDTLSCFVKKRKRANFNEIRIAQGEINAAVRRIFDNNPDKKIAIWGASHQGFTICAISGIAERTAFIIDSAPFKQGKYSPASHVRIISPQEAIAEKPDIIIIVTPTYSDEISGIIKTRFDKKTEVYKIESIDSAI